MPAAKTTSIMPADQRDAATARQLVVKARQRRIERMADRDAVDRQNEGHAAGQEHAGQRDDEGRHFKIVDDSAHNRAEQRGDHKHQREGCERMDAGVLQDDQPGKRR
jgi:hypothetical protein